MDVSATAVKSLFTFRHVFFGTGVITDYFHKAGMICESTDFLKMGHHAGVSSSGHVFKRNADTPSGPVAFVVHKCLKSNLTSWGSITSLASCSVTEIISKTFFHSEKSPVKIIQFISFLQVIRSTDEFLSWSHYFHSVP